MAQEPSGQLSRRFDLELNLLRRVENRLIRLDTAAERFKMEPTIAGAVQLSDLATLVPLPLEGRRGLPKAAEIDAWSKETRRLAAIANNGHGRRGALRAEREEARRTATQAGFLACFAAVETCKAANRWAHMIGLYERLRKRMNAGPVRLVDIL